jgi:L-2-amino-thiazoline-4-carboxylic acid hydrolase
MHQSPDSQSRESQGPDNQGPDNQSPDNPGRGNQSPDNQGPDPRSPDEPTVNDLYQWWWLHDAQWYQGVSKRFGPQAANEINAEALRFVAQRVAKGVAKRLGTPIEELPWPQVVEAFSQCAAKMWPAGLVDYDYEVGDPGEFEVTLRRSFTFVMLRRAGSFDTYECPCVEMRAGWFEGLGLKPEENRVTRCITKGAETCHLVAKVQGYPQDGSGGQDAPRPVRDGEPDEPR